MSPADNSERESVLRVTLSEELFIDFFAWSSGERPGARTKDAVERCMSEIPTKNIISTLNVRAEVMALRA